ncbi:MAG: hypothetical protein LBS16_00760 [Prevotellaceae bacterium]|jgi:uncharacterized protein (DUF1778 family)|nr:hypothetical protein [Prevotellaceae bacterium]
MSPKRQKMRRLHRISFTVNEDEMKLIERYRTKYAVDNMSNFLREAVIRTALKQLDEDSPTLFDKMI